MVKGEYKKILLEVFDVLGFSEAEKEEALMDIKKKFASEMLKAVQGGLPQEHQDWISNNLSNSEPDGTKAKEIHDAIKGIYTEEQLDKISHEIFGQILESYTSFMSKNLNADKIFEIDEIVSKF